MLHLVRYLVELVEVYKQLLRHGLIHMALVRQCEVVAVAPFQFVRKKSAAEGTLVVALSCGNRRFIAVRFTHPIRVNRMPNHRQLYAQALVLLKCGERTWFDGYQTKLIMRNNQQFEVQMPVDHYFHNYFVPAKNEEEDQWLTVAKIFSQLVQEVGSIIKPDNLIGFGRKLGYIHGLKHKRSATGTKYLVKRV